MIRGSFLSLAHVTIVNRRTVTNGDGAPVPRTDSRATIDDAMPPPPRTRPPHRSELRGFDSGFHVGVRRPRTPPLVFTFRRHARLRGVRPSLPPDLVCGEREEISLRGVEVWSETSPTRRRSLDHMGREPNRRQVSRRTSAAGPDTRPRILRVSSAEIALRPRISRSRSALTPTATRSRRVASARGGFGLVMASAPKPAGNLRGTKYPAED